MAGPVFRNERLEHELVGLLEGVLHLVIEPLSVAVERVEGTEDVNGRIGVADDEDRRIGVRLGGWGDRRRRRDRRTCGGQRGSDQDTYHASPSRLGET